jgi:creatinine amidohydrolase
MGCIHSHDHIALGIDNVGADAIARELSERTQTLLIPQLNFGWMPQYSTYDGTINVLPETLTKLLLEVIKDLHRWGIRKVIFINGHGGNRSILEDVGSIIRDWGMLAPILEWWTLARLFQLDREVELGPEYGKVRTRGVETSFAMALDMVDMDDLYVQEYRQIFGDALSVSSFQGVRFKDVYVPMPMKVRAVSKQGQKLTKATAERGREIIKKTNDFCAAFIEEIKKIDMKEVEKREAKD